MQLSSTNFHRAAGNPAKLTRGIRFECDPEGEVELIVLAAFERTPRALALVPVVAAAIGQFKDLFQASSFDPGTAERIIRIASADTQTILLGPRLMARLAVEAPSISLEMVPYRDDLSARMEDGSFDFAFALASTPLPMGTRSMPLATDRLAVVMRRGHPAAKRKWTLADYGKYNHATVALLGDRQSDMDTLLAEGGVTRRISFTCLTL